VVGGSIDRSPGVITGLGCIPLGYLCVIGSAGSPVNTVMLPLLSG
jgi:hypothetical protein